MPSILFSVLNHVLTLLCVFSCFMGTLNIQELILYTQKDTTIMSERAHKSMTMNNYTLNDMVTLSWEMLKKEWQKNGPTSSFLVEFSNDVKNRSQLQSHSVYFIAGAALLFTIHRYIYTATVLKPLGRYFNFTTKDQTKLLESGSKILYYSAFFMFEYYLVNFKYPDYINNPVTQWQGWYQEMNIPDDIFYLYMLEAGFYFHSIYATLFMDVWRKDSIAMLLHHILANMLIIFSYMVRYHRIGLVVLYLHDNADVLLEITKIVSFFKNKKSTTFLEVSTAVGFLSFSFSWFWCRLYVYPQVILFSAAYLSRKTLSHAQFYFLFNGMLWLLFALNVYWFHFIVALIGRIATGKSEEITDTREYDSCTMETHSNGGLKKEVSNGKTSNGSTKKGNGTVKENGSSKQGDFVLLHHKTETGDEHDTTRLRLRNS
ncbi:ceramide synthase 1-like [Hydractinia symbiolongicarpus]|uniref:ceramide synthase 1-like n=1 Tax=Hydractinia symbiolongicarpus TaxID=13093 RepID=UPI0025517F84|nr:ceramide synthase 1-like [Hydractinia symbiolongicarpus]